VLSAAGEVLRHVRKAKSEAKVSMRAEVAGVTVSGRGADLVRLGEQDVRAAGTIGHLALTETGGDLAVEVVLG
jgi:valyl-tRNA synthetase